jgi:hypothetical protein
MMLWSDFQFGGLEVETTKYTWALIFMSKQMSMAISLRVREMSGCYFHYSRIDHFMMHKILHSPSKQFTLTVITYFTRLNSRFRDSARTEICSGCTGRPLYAFYQ